MSRHLCWRGWGAALWVGGTTEMSLRSRSNLGLLLATRDILASRLDVIATVIVDHGRDYLRRWHWLRMDELDRLTLQVLRRNHLSVDRNRNLDLWPLMPILVVATSRRGEVGCRGRLAVLLGLHTLCLRMVVG